MGLVVRWRFTAVGKHKTDYFRAYILKLSQFELLGYIDCHLTKMVLTFVTHLLMMLLDV